LAAGLAAVVVFFGGIVAFDFDYFLVSLIEILKESI